MKNIGRLKLKISSSIRKALTIIDSGAAKIAIVVDKQDKLLGTLTDGDIRRALLNGKTLDDDIEDIFFDSPIIVGINDSREKIVNLCISKKIYQIPVVDDFGRVVDIAILDELVKPSSYANKVILMAGGLGTRLMPLTKDLPKPMLHVGNKPILQTIIEQFASYGFTNIVLCVNYKSQIICDYFGDGSKFGVKITYLFEEKKMGTAGALSLLSEMDEAPFFVMNGDLLTSINFEHLLDFHKSTASVATMCIREYQSVVPYGVVCIDDGRIKSIKEKPSHKVFVNAGIYVLDPMCIDLIPKNMFYDMPELFKNLINLNKNVCSFPIHEYWLDIGRIDEYKRANKEYNEIFNV